MLIDPLSNRHPAILDATFNAAGALGGGNTAPQRNLTSELNQTLKGYQQTAPGFLALNQQYQPLYTQLGLNTLGTQLGGYTDANGNYVPGTTALTQQANTSNRLANTADLGAIGPGTTSAILGNNPYLSDSLNSSDLNLANAQFNQPLLNQLNSQAQSQLSLNGALSPDQSRQLTQSTLGSLTNAGIPISGNTSIAAQLLGRDAFTQARQQQAQNFASGVQGLNTQNQALVGNLANAQGNLATSSLTNPLFQLLGLGNLTPGNTGGAAGGDISSIAAANSLFPQQSPFLNDIYSSNQNATASQNIANQNTNTALAGAGIGLLGSLFSDKRLKKDVKETGETTPEGIPLVTFRYKTDKTKRKWKGVMAQDVEAVRPDAVSTDPISGLKAVNYSKIGTLMEALAA